MAFFPKLSRIAQNKFGKSSPIYKAGAALYHQAFHLLFQLGVSPRFYPDSFETVRQILHQSNQCPSVPEGKHIAIMTIRDWRKHLIFESLLAARLKLEGHRVTFISCADSLTFCMNSKISRPFLLIKDCEQCLGTKSHFWGTNFAVHYIAKLSSLADNPINNLVKDLSLNECKSFEYENVPYGKLMLPSVVWFLRRSILGEQDVGLYRKALLSAHQIRHGVEMFFADNNVDCVVMLNGEFSAEKITGWICQQKAIPFITYDFTFHDLVGIGINRGVSDDLTFDRSTEIASFSISREEENAAEKILATWRKQGGYHGNLFWRKKDLADGSDIYKQIGLDKRHFAVAYTNMTYESSVIGKDNIFIDQFHWLEALVGFFNLNKQFQLVIRIHPAENRHDCWRPNESLYDFIIKRYPTLPGNVTIIPPHEKTSSYALGEAASVVLVYSSTIGMELADRKKIVITAAYTHYSGRGFTIDPVTEAEYFDAVTKSLTSPGSLSTDSRYNLVKYVAWLFLYRLIPFDPVASFEKDGRPVMNAYKLNDLISLKYVGLQRIVGLIIDRKRPW